MKQRGRIVNDSNSIKYQGFTITTNKRSFRQGNEALRTIVFQFINKDSHLLGVHLLIAQGVGVSLGEKARC